MRIGIGYDIHRFDAARPLVLGGVRIEGERGLAGHSDADVLLHAVIDALLGAAGLVDIGTHFPDDDDRWSGARSTDLLARTMELLDQQFLAVGNVDATVITEAPRLKPYLTEMRRSTASLLGIPEARVNVKAKTNEALGAIGQGDGMAAIAIALLTE